MIIGFGGTFNRVHEGHRAIADTICDMVHPGDAVIIGVTVRTYAERVQSIISAIRQAIEEHGYNVLTFNCLSDYYTYKESKNWSVSLISCMIHSLSESINLTEKTCDYLIASTESYMRAERVLDYAESNNGKPRLVVVPCVLNPDGTKVSSTDIVKGEQDAE